MILSLTLLLIDAVEVTAIRVVLVPVTLEYLVMSNSKRWGNDVL